MFRAIIFQFKYDKSKDNNRVGTNYDILKRIEQ